MIELRKNKVSRQSKGNAVTLVAFDQFLLRQQTGAIRGETRIMPVSRKISPDGSNRRSLQFGHHLNFQKPGVIFMQSIPLIALQYKGGPDRPDSLCVRHAVFWDDTAAFPICRAVIDPGTLVAGKTPCFDEFSGPAFQRHSRGIPVLGQRQILVYITVGGWNNYFRRAQRS